MRKIKEVLRLRFGLGLQQDQIARSCSIGQATVHRYLEKAAAAKLSWPLPDDWDDQRLDELLFPARPLRTPSQPRPGLDFASLQAQLQTHKHLTLQLLWEEYRETHPEGYGYSRFCELYQRWNGNRHVVLRQDHKAGEKMFVDWAGDTVPIHDRATGEAAPASIFVAVLGASTYTFARAALSQNLSNWIDCHVRSFEFFQGVTRLLVPDNPRTGVTRACRYEPLPAQRYVMAEWKTVRANIDYHVEIDRHYYSVPYPFAGQQLEARYTAATIEVFQAGKRVASHARSSMAYRHTTVHEHMPKSHRAHLEWTPSRLIHWGETVGTATAEVIRTILASKPHPEMGYRACLGILRLAKTYSDQRLEAASQRALQLQACSYSSLRSILKRSLDRQSTLAMEPGKPGPQHENVRGADYYDPPTTLLQ